MFIAIEGVAGAGKTTQVDLLSKRLQKNNKSVFISTIYERERKQILEDFIKKIDIKNNDLAITYLFQVMHSLQYQEVKRELKINDYVIADRWRTTFLSYHTLFGELSKYTDIVFKLDELTFKNLNADINILLDVSPEIAFERYRKREKNKQNSIGLKNIDFFSKTIDFYKKYASKNNWIILNGDDHPQTIHNNIVQVLK